MRGLDLRAPPNSIAERRLRERRQCMHSSSSHLLSARLVRILNQGAQTEPDERADNDDAEKS